ncbi:MAG: ribosome recycling factor [Francisellaceae bacterium]|jgi:ribosome recycling factor|nr:ribosome recycling factor [Francisellaceae bacterium]MBT6206623.1 ribosome recycling factor [Francisellaceae bacterium]MBT6539527.1 ribosome recycling factor [Francisellaceae bacterium]
MIDNVNKDAEKKMEKGVEALNRELSKIRTGRAHPSLLETIKVSYYDAMTPISQVATIVVEDARTLAVTPYDKSMISKVEKAIITSSLGVNPATTGEIIRVPLPPLTEERRKDLTKQMKSEVENSRVSIRTVRRDANQTLKELLKKKAISEDLDRQGQDEIQKLTDKYIKKIDEVSQSKELELMQM